MGEANKDVWESVEQAGRVSGHVDKIWSLIWKFGMAFFGFLGIAYATVTAPVNRLEARVLQLEESLTADVARLEQNQNLLGQRIASMELSIEDLTPPPVITEYKPGSARQMGVCRINAVCMVRMEALRSTFGAACEVKSIQPKLINHFGQTFYLQYVNFKPVNLDDEREATLMPDFRPPPSVLPGLSFYVTRIEYHHCQPDRPETEENEYTRVYVENAPKIPVNIEPAE
ncbi:MAG: hypothetical protein JJ891_16745 [Rhizobiaceae bacterium]|nr:hypothetical protein [Rhizobiaceae bacterium]